VAGSEQPAAENCSFDTGNLLLRRVHDQACGTANFAETEAATLVSNQLAGTNNRPPTRLRPDIGRTVRLITERDWYWLEPQQYCLHSISTEQLWCDSSDESSYRRPKGDRGSSPPIFAAPPPGDSTLRVGCRVGPTESCSALRSWSAFDGRCHRFDDAVVGHGAACLGDRRLYSSHLDVQLDIQWDIANENWTSGIRTDNLRGQPSSSHSHVRNDIQMTTQTGI